MKKNTDFSKIFKSSHEGKWVALSADRSKVIATGENLVTLKNKVKSKDVVFTKVLPRDTSFAF